MIRQEGIFSLFKGTGAIVAGITPKVIVRFNSFEWFKSQLPVNEKGKPSSSSLFIAGLLAGSTEAVLVVTPSEVIKIRMQDDNRGGSGKKYTSISTTFRVMMKEEGAKSFFKGVGATTYR